MQTAVLRAAVCIFFLYQRIVMVVWYPCKFFILAGNMQIIFTQSSQYVHRPFIEWIYTLDNLI